MSSSPVLGQKRKALSEVDFPPGTFGSAEGKGLANGTAGALPSKGEYETGRVICESCGEGISFRDEDTNTFTVKHWDAHRTKCPMQSKSPPESPVLTPDPSPVVTQPIVKRRRAKRTEEERIDYLRSDPYVAQFEAYRVLCASCDKWIRLRPNSTYCSIPWDAHRKSCLGKRVAKNPHACEERKAAFANEPAIRKVEAHRVFCGECETWVPVGTGDNVQAIKAWRDHQANCKQTASNGTPLVTSCAPANIPTIDSVPPSKHLLALSSSPLPSPFTSTPRALVTLVPKPAAGGPTAPSVLTSPTAPFKDLTPTNFAAIHESRRRNAEQRAAALRSDGLVGEVEPHRVFCSMCRKWVQLRQDSSYCAYPWMQHRDKCYKRHMKRTEKNAQFAERKAQGALNGDASLSDGADDSDEPESEEGVESGDEDDKARIKTERHDAKIKIKAQIKSEAAAVRQHFEAGQEAFHGVCKSNFSDVEMKSEDVEMSFAPPLADLETPSGRMEFVFRSVRYLFCSTYTSTDELTIATLVTYLNAAMPPDRHEDYETAEVMKAAMALNEQGQFSLEGDVLRIAG